MIVRQAANVLDLLEFFATHGKIATLAEISAHFGWPRSSTFNLISTLVERGFLHEARPRGGYYPTPRWLTLAQQISAAEPMPESLQAILQDLAHETGETVWIAAPSGQYVILMTVIQSAHGIRYAAEPGRRIPIHTTASGQALMSQMTPAQCTAILRKAVFERFGDGTPMSIEAVEDSIRTSLARGWFRSASSFSPDLGGVSVPIRLGGRIFSATVAGPLFRISDRMEENAHKIHQAIARHLGPRFLEENVPNLHRLPV